MITIPGKALEMSVDTALEWYDSNQEYWNGIARKYACDSKEVAAIGLPEVERYLEWQNQLETLALNEFYVDKGSEAVDFSIGYFQMKPSFIEKLECEIVEDACLMEMCLSLIPSADLSPREIRIFRLEQLSQPHIQFEYLCAYYLIMEKRFPDWNNKKDKIRFFASAYNYGYDKDEDKIRTWMKIKSFPYGSRFNFTQDAYADVAFYIFNQLTNKMEEIHIL